MSDYLKEAAEAATDAMYSAAEHMKTGIRLSRELEYARQVAQHAIKVAAAASNMLDASSNTNEEAVNASKLNDKTEFITIGKTNPVAILARRSLDLFKIVAAFTKEAEEAALEAEKLLRVKEDEVSVVNKIRNAIDAEKDQREMQRERQRDICKSVPLKEGAELTAVYEQG